MRPLFIVIVCFLTTHVATAQLEPSYLENVRNSPKAMTLDILKQKKTGDKFETTKHTRYELTLKGPAIQSQKVYDTMSNIAYNKSLSYKYDSTIDENLIEIVQNDFEENIMKQTKYTYDERGLLLLKDEQFDGSGAILQTITQDFGGCTDAALIEGLPSDVKYTCVTKDFTNRVSSRKSVEVFGSMGMLVKKINYQDDGSISNTETSQYDEDGKLVLQEKTTSSGRSYKTNYTYNEKGEIATKKASFVEFHYAYEYDKNGNWTQMIETTKVPTKRVVYKRTFKY